MAYIVKTTWQEGDEMGDTDTTVRFMGPMPYEDAKRKAQQLNVDHKFAAVSFGVMDA